jgi:UDP-N-acetyl-D-galactosamine dehydrogenase
MLDDFLKNGEKVCIVGLGYVGLPLAVAMAEKFTVIGFDINEKRIGELNENHDRTDEVEASKLESTSAVFSSDPEKIKEAKVIIVTVPTPIDEYNIPDLTPVEKASQTVGKFMSKGAIVVYESTVYPGVTEELCVPILEKESGLKWKKDFNVGYSPERVNPGDKDRPIQKILKIVSGDTKETADFLTALYGEVIVAGIHTAPTIKTAEAAKVIENTQRDINIALMNELALIFDIMDIDTKSVLEAAGTKWNFLRFEPGLVGGHCIGVDPYYLTFKAEAIGYHPEMILSGRRLNDNMGKYIAEKTVKMLINSGKAIKGAKVLICGFTFKEDCPDTRNTRVIDVYNELLEYGVDVSIYDPVAIPEEVDEEYGIKLVQEIGENNEAVVLAVKHKEFKDVFKKDRLTELVSENGVLIDIKSFLDPEEIPENINFWRL